ncbi:putative membrane protein [Kitasatospora sp. GP30]|uniref:DUF2079 domain-containing protein n=1 Tax=Kitasatospora sp. GP30 TaxID=3035084 RepID=UPI000C6FCD4E|nr:DUF2079 domain-containing protein [Kitasatospora sp. GP30]MDH6139002.1 putative membrane protein [Kitasatospora sp. GP30]
MAETRESAIPSQRVPVWGRTGRAAQAARQGRLREAGPHLALAVLFLLGYGLVELLRYQRFAAPSWDLGIFTEAVKGYAHFGAPTLSIKGPGYNALGDHWSPIVALLAPVWWVWPSPVMLLAAQAALFAWSIGVVSDTTERVLGSRSKGLLIGAAYGLSWGLQRAIDFEFHEIAFAVPLLAVVCRQLLFKRWDRAAWWAMPLVLVKEDMGLTVAAVGVVLLVTARRRSTAAGLVLFGLGFAALTVGVLIPHFNPQHQYDYWAKLPGGTHPQLWQLAIAPFTRLTVWKTCGWLLGIVGFLALRSPLVLLALPTLAWRFASSNSMFWGQDWHYNATLMPILFLALVDAIARLRAGNAGSVLRGFAEGMVPGALAIGAACTVSLPVGVGGLADPGTWSGGQHAAALRDALALVPRGVTVESTMGPLSRLAAADDAYWVGGCKPNPPQYLVLDTEGWNNPPTDLPAYGAAFHPGARFTVVFNRDQVTVLRRQ